MTYKLIINSKNPPTDALIVAEVIKSQNKEKIEVVWCNDWKSDGNVRLMDSQGKVLGERSNDVGRYFARTTHTDLYGGINPRERTEVDHWLSFAIGCSESLSLKENALQYLDNALMTTTWLVSKKLTLADIHVFCILLNKQFLAKFEKQFANITRWYKQILSLSVVEEVLSSIKKNAIMSAPSDVKSEKTNGKQGQTGQRKQEGKFIDLPGAEMGKVVVRFPPEASGYLHIGHAKAALLNQYYAEAFKGQLIMRFDDTNPAKENVEFEKAILEDLELLQIKPDRFTHSSDYFDLMLQYCTKLIKEGMAYVDDTNPQLMKEQRDQKLMSSNRNNSIEKNLEKWNEMQQGTPKGQECCVRAKIDYESANGCLRDPTIYRCKPEPHPRTGTKYKVYPTYDFACPIVDAIENVTHTLRTTEYHDRDAQFYWFVDALGLRRPYIWEYSRLNMTNTVLSKRKLTWFVDSGLVDGWDDPRFPTVRGILRRGMTVEGLKQFIIAQGSSRSVVFMEWDKIWAFNKKVIDPIATRYTAMDYDKLVPVHIDNVKEDWLTVQNHPKDPSKGTKQVLTSSLLYIERDDADMLVENQNTTFINWGNILINKIEKENGVVKKILAQLNLENKDYKNTLKITWLAIPSDETADVKKVNSVPCYAVYFDHIISKPVLGKDDDFKNFVAKVTRREVQMLGEEELKRVKKGEIIQLQRKGFFRCDVPYAAASPFSSREQPLVLFHIPDGHTPNAVKTASITVPTTSTKESSQKNGATQDANVINESIVAQGEKVRNLKSQKADKAAIDTEVKILLSLKADYKKCTGKEWTLRMTPNKSLQTTPVNSDKNKLFTDIIQQENEIKELQLKINQEMQRLSKLKTEYKNKTGTDWAEIEKKSVSTESSVNKLLNEIQKQGDRVRQLKSSKAEKSIVDDEVKKLLALKSDYKSMTGQDWNPSSATMLTTCDKVTALTTNITSIDGEQISKEIEKQGDKVRQLKASKAQKDIIDQEVKLLLKLKADYKAATGEAWKPCATPPTNAKNKEENNIDQLSDNIQSQGNKVRQLKDSKSDKSLIDQEVKILLDLKNNYKQLTGQEWKPQKSDVSSKKKKKEDTSKNEKQKNALNKEIVKAEGMKDPDAGKTGTRLGMEVKKEENFFEWYSQIITKSGMIEYYDVSGCYILRPWSFTIWKVIKGFIDTEIEKLGVQECYFPIFVTRTVLEKEKAHIADFAPEVAWVTKCGESDLAEPIAIRPTSETVMYPAYAKWLRSDTELPLKLNQWNNVVRWEFKDPKPFLRTREFLWQEGHTAFATKAEADEEVMIILNMYAQVYEDLLAVPVVKGRKTEKEKFAGGDYTTTIEAFISTSGRAIQGATSHHLGQNFSKMFNIQIEGATDGDEKTFVYQNSWGLTTRTIGVMIMIHGDDKGLVLPPKVACIQAVIIPCGITANTTPQQRELLFNECNKLLDELSKDKTLRVKADYRNNRTPGWKFNHWELKGVPVRIELGPKDLEKNQVTFVRRDTSERVVANRLKVLTALHELLTDIQSSLLAKARKDLNDHIKRVDTWIDFCSELNKKNILLSPFCGEMSCEDNIKADSARDDIGEEPGTLSMGAKSLCIPFQQPSSSIPLDKQKCIHPSCQNKPKFYTLFGRSY
ncbi:bifunctional glutamate/proline--tRNA ligase [Hylaeus anthracinus]|uniref:bifunctional glutamate/proline--tRNA ligase n=1 Tax=Hylaeus anthracinus TaxID=313031 RepID=UPI0023B9571F|nr:bifunctional glutamate/proline--tRNA ligase [Hylaeus anthracinus]